MNYRTITKPQLFNIINFCVFIFQIILNSMHRFQPRIYLVIRPDGSNAPITDIEREKYRTYIFPETIFTAVTAYQNQLVSNSLYFIICSYLHAIIFKHLFMLYPL